jgi:restriction system protein
MGGIWLTRRELATSLSEHAGHKAGIALSLRDLKRHLPGVEYLIGRMDHTVRIRSEEYEMLAGKVLYALGNTPTPERIFFPGMRAFHRLKKVPGGLDLYTRVMTLFNDTTQAQLGNEGPIDLTPFLKRSREEVGIEGAALALEIIDDVALGLQQSVMARYRRVQWSDAVDLKDLFESEALAPQYGYFIDQRYVDYLAQNFGSIDEINWRKFEALTAEFFKRRGLHVELSAGRNDDNVDLRLWTDEPSETTPPLVLVQCKRQKEKVGKVVVKALYADVLHEGAKSGLIVTSTEISPGAKQTSLARGYPVQAAEREALRSWIDAMRTPFSGIFMGT